MFFLSSLGRAKTKECTDEKKRKGEAGKRLKLGERTDRTDVRGVGVGGNK